MNKIAEILKVNLSILFLLVALISCNTYKEEDATPLAILDDKILYFEDIKQYIPEALTSSDSLAFIDNYITKWATQQLLIDQAKLNLPEYSLERFSKMVSEYEVSLYTEAYKNAYVSKQQDTSISKLAIQDFYEKNKENFHLNNEMLKIRYIGFDKDYTDKTNVEKAFKRFNLEDQELLTQKSYQFKKINLNDSVWIKKDNLFLDLVVLKEKEQDLKKGEFIELQDSLTVYLLKVRDKLYPNDIAPLSYLEPTIREILLNTNRIELIKKLEKDIIKDAIQNNKLQILTP